MREPAPLALARRVGRRLARRRPSPVASLTVPPALLELRRHGPVALVPRDADPKHLDVAVVVPSFRRGSGGHATIVNLLSRLERTGHRCSLWLEDSERWHTGDDADGTARRFREYFGELQATLHVGFGAWTGADVALATGWQTVPRVLRLHECGARAYLVQDHEPDFYATSAEAAWASETYRLGLHCIAASRWLAERLADEYGASATHFDLGVDHELYRPQPVDRRNDQVIFYARPATPRRATALGLLALTELHRRRPRVDLALFGSDAPIDASFGHRHLGVLEPSLLARVYSEATVGLVLSMTNPSLVPQEMLACGLPCVELASESVVATFGADGPLELADFDALALADAIERLLDDPDLRAQRSRSGREAMSTRTWEAAASQVEQGLRAALAGAGTRGV